VQLADFEAMVRRLTGEIPPEFLEGVAEITVSPRVVPHPERPAVWTLGECIPLPTTDQDPRSIQSRIVLYFGSFQALSHGAEHFDWRQETWETLTHELRHHVEWKARAPDLEAFDAAAEANFARHADQPFDPLFYRDGVERPDGAYQVDDDVFIEHLLRGAAGPEQVSFRWAGRAYRVSAPAGVTLPAFLLVEGVDSPPEGDLVLVLRGRTRLRDLFRREPVFTGTVEAEPVPDYVPGLDP
jgi:hypothetical protein